MHTRALLDNGRLQRDMKRMVQKMEVVARLLNLEQAKQDDSAAVGQLKKDILTVALKVREQAGTLTAS